MYPIVHVLDVGGVGVLLVVVEGEEGVEVEEAEVVDVASVGSLDDVIDNCPIVFDVVDDDDLRGSAAVVARPMDEEVIEGEAFGVLEVVEVDDVEVVEVDGVEIPTKLSDVVVVEVPGIGQELNGPNPIMLCCLSNTT